MCCLKQLLFLLELEDLLDVMDPMQFKKIVEPVCTQIAKCASSPHSLVSILSGMYIVYILVAWRVSSEVLQVPVICVRTCNTK